MLYPIVINYKTKDTYKEIDYWCRQTFGNHGEVWTKLWAGPHIDYGTQYCYWFNEHKDATLFSLRWL